MIRSAPCRAAYFNPHSRMESDVPHDYGINLLQEFQSTLSHGEMTVPTFSPDVVRGKCHKIANLFFRLLKIVRKDNKIPISPYVARGANLLGI